MKRLIIICLAAGLLTACGADGEPEAPAGADGAAPVEYGSTGSF